MRNWGPIREDLFDLMVAHVDAPESVFERAFIKLLEDNEIWREAPRSMTDEEFADEASDRGYIEDPVNPDEWAEGLMESMPHFVHEDFFVSYFDAEFIIRCAVRMADEAPGDERILRDLVKERLDNDD